MEGKFCNSWRQSFHLEEWEHERKVARSFFSHQELRQIMTKVVWKEIETGLIPVLDHVSKQGLTIDLQDLFKKHILDIAWMMTIGYNPNSLSIECQIYQFSKTLEDACEVAFSRFLMPESFWKLQW
ncbi:hypothetical protein REPUB_Repub04eG0011700 [Reevesia pubescens]